MRTVARAIARLLTACTALAATQAAAQGQPPFDLPDDASRSTQVVRMQLGLNDPEEASPNFDEMTADSQFQATLNRTTLGNGATGTGRLIMFPLGIAGVLLPTAGGPLLSVQPQDSGTRSILVLESPSVTPSLYAPYVDVGTYGYDINCSGVVCSQWLESPIESRAESSYDHLDGTLGVDASVITPDYGVTDDTEDLYHALRSTASATPQKPTGSRATSQSSHCIVKSSVCRSSSTFTRKYTCAPYMKNINIRRWCKPIELKQSLREASKCK